MLRNIEAHLESLRISNESSHKIEFYEMLAKVYNAPFLDGSLESEVKLFDVLQDIDMVQKVVSKRRELSAGLKLFKMEEHENYPFEKEEAKRELAELGYVDHEAEDLPIGSTPRDKQPKEATKTLEKPIMYEVNDVLVVKRSNRHRESKKETPAILKNAFGPEYRWSYIEAKFARLLDKGQSFLAVVPSGVNVRSLVALATREEKRFCVVGEFWAPYGNRSCTIELAEKRVRNGEVTLVFLEDAWDLIENKEEALLRLGLMKCRVVALINHVKNLGDVADFLGIKEVFVFNEDFIDTEYVGIPDGPSTENAGLEWNRSQDFDNRANVLIWEYCSNLPKPVLIVTESLSETLSCARFIFGKSLNNKPQDVDKECPKEMQNFLSHRISVNEYVTDNIDFYITEKKLSIVRKAQSLIIKGTKWMGRNDFHKLVTKCSYKGGTAFLKKVVLLTKRDSVSFFADQVEVKSNLLGRVYEALNLEIFNGRRSFSECKVWFSLTFLSRTCHLNIKNALLNLQKKGLVCFRKGFEPTQKGCIAARYKSKVKDLDILYSVEKHLTDYKLFSLLNRIHDLSYHQDGPIPTKTGKLVQFLIVRKDPHERRVLRLLNMLFHVCVDKKLSASKLVLRYSRSIENKCFASLSKSFMVPGLWEIALLECKCIENRIKMTCMIGLEAFTTIHIFITDVSDVLLLDYKLIRIKKNKVDFHLPSKRFYNISIISAEKQWRETRMCIDTHEALAKCD